MAQLTDESPMPWGKYKGEKMANVPASYLLYIYYANGQYDKDFGRYVLDNWDVIKAEVKREKEKQRK